ncbi:hypothetical protein [Aquamicrobium sp. LC103]|uniref:hypothetical protein n=1 Tax=Aquamicrobium sp. LC103 TaxID=1120658 RepID=UPI00063E7A9A|nr:hypothetical protein [Aquamicrobium sp. LC103]TKT77383.1 hypothetical protein XW59_012970 [Aquamicrobium sp. LC103]
MTDEPHRTPYVGPSKTVLARLKAMWRCARAKADNRRALADIEPRATGLEDAGIITREEAGHFLERQRLHRIADWTRLRGRGL